MLGHWKIDCPKAKSKKESKTEANLTQQVGSTQASTLQVGGSDSDLLVFYFSVTIPIVGY